MVRWSGGRRPVLVVVSALAACHAFVAGMVGLAVLKEVWKPLGFFERAEERVLLWVVLAVIVGAIVAEFRLASAAYELPDAVARADREGTA